MVGRLADVVQQAGAAGQVAVHAHLFGHHAGDERHFDRMPQHVLAVAGAVVQPAEQVDDSFVAGRGLAFPARPLRRSCWICASISFCVSATSSSIRDGMDAAVGDQLVERDAGDFAAHRIEAR